MIKFYAKTIPQVINELAEHLNTEKDFSLKQILLDIKKRNEEDSFDYFRFDNYGKQHDCVVSVCYYTGYGWVIEVE